MLNVYIGGLAFDKISYLKGRTGKEERTCISKKLDDARG